MRLLSDWFKIKINLRDLFKISIGSDNPGDRRRTTTNTHQVNSNNNSSTHGGVFVPLALTQEQVAGLMKSEPSEGELPALTALRNKLIARN